MSPKLARLAHAEWADTLECSGGCPEGHRFLAAVDLERQLVGIYVSLRLPDQIIECTISLVMIAELVQYMANGGIYVLPREFNDDPEMCELLKKKGCSTDESA